MSKTKKGEFKLNAIIEGYTLHYTYYQMCRVLHVTTWIKLKYLSQTLQFSLPTIITCSTPRVARTTIAFIQSLRYAGVIRLLFLIVHLHLIGVWLGVDTIKIHKDTCFKEIGLRLQLLLTTSHSMMDITIEFMTCVFNQEVNKHALLKTMIIKLEDV